MGALFSLASATTLLCAAVVAGAFMSPVPALAGTDKHHLSSDPEVRNARALVENRRYEEALAILRPLAPGHPDRTDVLFLVGLAAIEASARAAPDRREKLLDEAIAALRDILVDRPRLVRVRLELARAFFLKGEDELSQEHFERVLAGKLPKPVVFNIRRFLTEIRARRRWSGHFGFSIAPDSNINSASDDKVIWLRLGHFLLPFQRDPKAGAKSGVGVVMWGGWEYQYPIDNGTRLRAGFDLSRREYSGGKFDQTYVGVHAGPRWRLDEATDLSVVAEVSQHISGGKKDHRRHGARLEVDRRIGPRLTARGRASLHQRVHQRKSKQMDGPIASLSLGGSYLVTPTVQARATIGHIRERPKSANWRNATRWGQVGVSTMLPLGFTVGADAELHRTQYEAPYFSLDGSDRQDRMRILRLSALNRAFTVVGFSPQIAFVNEVCKSNAQMMGYRRNRGELRFIRQF